MTMDVNVTTESMKAKIIEANNAYRVGNPVMGDWEFDELCEAYEARVTPEEYAAFRNSLHEKAGKVMHPFVMGSLSKVKREEVNVLGDFLKKLKANGEKVLNVTRKVDGISCRLHYSDGKLVSGSTRGDGSFGEDISDKVKFVKGVASSIPEMGEIDIRGELVIFGKDLAPLNSLRKSKGEREFAARRNAVAGLFNSRGGGTPDEICFTSFVPYTIMGPKFPKKEQMEKLASWGFSPVVCREIPIDGNTDEDMAFELEHTIEKFDAEDYEGDGLVICGNNHHEEDAYIPAYVMAFKMNRQVAETVLLGVDWGTPSKDGTLCPVGILSPIDLNGVIVSRVTLHNLDFIAEKKLKVGSRVQIVRSGDVIPYLSACLDNSENESGLREIELPTECPCCHGPVARIGVTVACVNPDCEEKIVAGIVRFLEKLDIKGFKANMLKSWGVKSFDKILTFKPVAGMKNDEKFMDAISNVILKKSEKDLLLALNFKGLSDILLNTIVNHYGFENVKAMVGKKVYEVGALPPNVGEVRMEEFLSSLPGNLEIVAKFINDSRYEAPVETEVAAETSSVNERGSICVTGSLNFGSRGKFLEMAKTHGWVAKPGVAKGLTYLITNDAGSNSSKNRKAKELGIKVISEAEFMSIIDG